MVQQEIYRQMEVERAAAGRLVRGTRRPSRGAEAVPVTTPDVADQITKLAALRDQGHITPEEYEAKKAELLERM